MILFRPKNYRFAGFAVVIGLILAISPPFCLAGGQAIWKTSPVLADLIREAMENNAGIKSRAARVKAAEARVSVSGALPDPKLGFAVQSLPTDTFNFDQEPMTQKQIFVEQSVPWLSKLTLRSQSTASSARQAEAELDAARLALAEDIAVAWYELGYVAESQRINERLRELVSRIRRDAQSSYAVGKGLQQNIFQAEVEASRLEDQSIMLANQRRTIEDRLNGLLNRQTYSPIKAPENLPDPDFSPAPGPLAEHALETNPELRGLRAALARSETETRLAEKGYYPDFNFRLTYGQRDEDRTGRDLPDFLSAAVVVNIPLWHKTKQAKEVAAAVENRHSAANQHRDRKSWLYYEIQSLAAEIRDVGRRYRLYADELIPQADQWARSALEAYQVGKVEFDTMIDAGIRVLRYQQEASRLFYTAYQKKARLEALVGIPAGAGQ